MGMETAPVVGSGSWPAWMARVAKPCLWVMGGSKKSKNGATEDTESTEGKTIGARNAGGAFPAPRQANGPLGFISVFSVPSVAKD